MSNSRHESMNPEPEPQVFEECSKDSNPALSDLQSLSLRMLENCSRSATAEEFAVYEETERIRLLMAANPQTPPDVLTALADGAQARLLRKIAEHPRTPASTLAKLARHPDMDVRAAVAENLNTPIELLWLLVDDESPDVRYTLSESYHLPPEMLNVLAQDENPFVAYRAKQTLMRVRGAEVIEVPFLAWRDELAGY